MNLVKTGRSIDNFLMGSQKFKDDYIGVLDDVLQSLDIEEAFEVFRTRLLNENNVKIKQAYTEPCTVVDADDNTYTLAHETIIKEEKGGKQKNKLIQRPSNLLRHLCTRDFRLENIYIDENKNLVDITANALADKDRRILNPQIKLSTVVEYNPYSLIKCLYYVVSKGFFLTEPEYTGILNSNFQRLRPINIEDSKQLEIMVTKDPAFFYDQISKFNSSKWYFTSVCNLKFEVKYVGQKNVIMPFSSSFFNVIDVDALRADNQPVNNQIEDEFFVNELRNLAGVPIQENVEAIRDRR